MSRVLQSRLAAGRRGGEGVDCESAGSSESTLSGQSARICGNDRKNRRVGSQLLYPLVFQFVFRQLAGLSVHFPASSRSIVDPAYLTK